MSLDPLASQGDGMASSHAAELAELTPEGLETEGASWQQRKSVQTRLAVLEAAVDCLERHGYANTTTQLIAATAEISRGAMLHHYATKAELISAVTDYTFFKRMEAFVGRIRDLSEVERVRDQAGIELYWESLLTREYSAYLELTMASRTDPELREIFLPKARRYDRVEREMVLQAFPEWRADVARYELAMDYCIASMEGLLLNRDVWNDEGRRARLRAFISRTLLHLRDEDVAAAALAAE